MSESEVPSVLPPIGDLLGKIDDVKAKNDKQVLQAAMKIPLKSAIIPLATNTAAHTYGTYKGGELTPKDYMLSAGPGGLFGYLIGRGYNKPLLGVGLGAAAMAASTLAGGTLGKSLRKEEVDYEKYKLPAAVLAGAAAGALASRIQFSNKQEPKLNEYRRKGSIT